MMVKMRKRTLAIVLTILAFTVIGTILSTFYTDKYQDFVVHRVSYGFPISWHGYEMIGGPAQSIAPHPTEIHWFSLESFLLDIAFWFAISSLAVIVTMKSVNMLRKTRASKKLSVISACYTALFYPATYQIIVLTIRLRVVNDKPVVH
jgi:hypothetical protein